MKQNLHPMTSLQVTRTVKAEYNLALPCPINELIAQQSNKYQRDLLVDALTLGLEALLKQYAAEQGNDLSFTSIGLAELASYNTKHAQE